MNPFCVQISQVCQLCQQSPRLFTNHAAQLHTLLVSPHENTPLKKETQLQRSLSARYQWNTQRSKSLFVIILHSVFYQQMLFDIFPFCPWFWLSAEKSSWRAAHCLQDSSVPDNLNHLHLFPLFLCQGLYCISVNCMDNAEAQFTAALQVFFYVVTVR